MSFENLNEGMFEQIPQDEMTAINGGLLAKTTLTDITATGGDNKIDAGDLDGGCGCSQVDAGGSNF